MLVNQLIAAASVAALAVPAKAAEHIGAPAETANTADRFQIAVQADRSVLNPVLAVRQERGENADTVIFATHCNYRAFVERAEIRLYRAGGDPARDEPLAILPVDQDGYAIWHLPADLPTGVVFMLRAYAAKGGLPDETGLAPLDLSASRDNTAERRPIEDQVQHRAISVSGVTVTVKGRADRAGETVRVDGLAVPLDTDGRFVAEQIVPRATGIVHIEIRDGDDMELAADHHYDATTRRWFVVGQGDITFSHAIANGPAVAISGDSLLDGDHLSSRGAFYAKGTVDDDFRVTASLDTGEVLLKDMLSNLDRKDPVQLLRRSDERYQYPTFGDASTITEDAPSQGRFYLRVQKDDSNLVVGNFITAAKGTELVQLDRGLFGAMVDYKTRRMTRYGERKRQVLAFASDPGTITAADELRGTGGSLYYLRHQDISIGSERLRLEVRSQQTGAVLASNPLRINEDYEVDYFQGRVTLLHPLSTYLPNDELVRAGSATGNVPVLVARYEYTPPQGTIAGHSIGGRASQWIGDWLRLGITAQSETSAPADQLALGGDIMLKAGVNTWLQGELGRTDGPGFAQSSSLDGGLNFVESGGLVTAGRTARAWRVAGALDEGDLVSSLRGKASGYYEDYEAGYAALGRVSATPMRRWGTLLDQPIGAAAHVVLAYEGRQDRAAGGVDLARAEWTQTLNPVLSVRSGLRFEDVRLGQSSVLMRGQRLDGAIQATYARPGASWSTYVFGQGTLARDQGRHANDRGGLGIKWNLIKGLSAEGEASVGTGGWAANAGITRRASNGSDVRIGYRLYADPADRGYNPQEWMTQPSRGVLVVGSQQKVADNLTFTAEEKYGHGGTAPNLAHAYGLRFNPAKAWSFGAGIEKNTVFDGHGGNEAVIDRLAATVSAGYLGASSSATSAVEFRKDRQGSGQQSSWLFRNKVDATIGDGWRLMARLDYAFTNVAGASLNAADYTRFVSGFAYRPVSHDRLNLLARYTYMRDLGPSGQIMTGSGTEQPKQVSQIISLDASYDAATWLTIGSKYARREGRVSIARASDAFVDSTANLYVMRTDFHPSPDWDLLAEGRLLNLSQTGDSRTGVLLAVYRKIGGGMKLGGGYNFADYSADLTDQGYSTRGVFVNLMAAF